MHAVTIPVVFGFILLLLLPWYTRDVAAEITRGHQNHTQTGRRTNLPTVQLLQQTVGKFLGPTNHTYLSCRFPSRTRAAAGASPRDRDLSTPFGNTVYIYPPFHV
jgi:hypothetical protein